MKKVHAYFKRYAYLWLILLLIVLAAITLWKQTRTNKPKIETIKVVSIRELPDFSNAKLQTSFKAFMNSCDFFLKKAPDVKVGSRFISMRASDWHGVCKKAKTLKNHDDKTLRIFFEDNFIALQFPNKGLFTGYYVPEIPGSLEKKAPYIVPLYGVPKDIVVINLEDFDSAYHRTLYGRVKNGHVIPYLTRKEINQSQTTLDAPVIAYVKNTIDRLFLEIQGSGVIALPDKKELYINYALENGHSYTPVGKVLLNRKLLEKDNISMQSIREYLLNHPEESDEIINQNKSFVFFRIRPINAFPGAQTVPLTNGHSLAVDRLYIPLGAPVWLSTTYPDPKTKAMKPLKRLMIAQDTGGAIRGVVRGDVFWGAGVDAEQIAGHMKNQGSYWLLLPKHIKPPKSVEF